MKLYSENEHYKLYQGSMLDMLEVIKPNTIDSIVTDPPYGLTSITKRFGKEGSAPASTKNNDGSFARLSKGFMGKEWDGSGIEYNIETWRKCYEVLKPGGYLLAFGGSRTFHRIACAIEDAGFEIRDTIMWIYGMGFPKSQNIGKQLEKRLEDEKTKQKTEHDLRLMWERDIQKTERELQRCKVCEMSKRVSINGEERWICNGTQVSDGETLREMLEQSGSCTSYRPQSEQQQDRELNAIQEQCRTQESREIIEYWNKFGTALKPSFEPIIVARKPFKGSLVDNVIEYGVGGLNIDECRVGNEIIKGGTMPKMGAGDLGVCNYATVGAERLERQDNIGRFPANTILTYDETDFDEVCGGFPNNTASYRKGNRDSRKAMFDFGSQDKTNQGYTDSGSASRYFYCAKASKKDRDEGLDEFEEKNTMCDRNPELASANMPQNRSGNLRKNTHPTVKPTELMQYLVRLVSPNGATILDPFNGSGSTGKAVMYENKERNKNYKYIGIELTEEYLPISKARIEYVCKDLESDEERINEIDELDLSCLD